MSGRQLPLYSTLKPLAHPERLELLRRGIAPEPVHLQLILSDLCNHDCSFCAYRISTGLSNELFPDAEGRRNPRRMIETWKAYEIVDDAAELGIKAIQFTGGGEPTVHPDHAAIFERAQDHGIDTGLVTNGIKIDADRDAFSLMEWIRVSVDAGDPETYARVRRCPSGHWGKVWSNISKLAARWNWEDRVLGVGFVVTTDNWRGIRECARLAKNSGANNVRVGAIFSTEGSSIYAGLEREIHDVIASAKSELDGDGFEIVDLFTRRIDDLDEGSPDFEFCGYQYITWYVGGDLNVYRCCNTSYTRAGTVGSLVDRRLRDVLGEHVGFDARGCRHCQFLAQNRAITEYLRGEQDAIPRGTLRHENFV